MNENAAQDKRLLREIRLTNLLSFGSEAEALPLECLNVFIGPNGAGKSNLIEALALMRATTVMPQATSSADVRGVLRRGGGAGEWIWKGAKGNPASVELVVSNPKGSQALRHVFSFRNDAQGFVLQDERVENETSYSGLNDPYFFYRFQNGHPVVNVIVQEESEKSLIVHDSPVKRPTDSAPRKERKLAKETVNLEVSILAQRRDPERYPEITHLADTRNCTNAYEKGKRSYEVVAELNPATLRKYLPSFVRIDRILNSKL